MLASSHFTCREWHLHLPKEETKCAAFPVPAHTQSCPLNPPTKLSPGRHFAAVGAGSIKTARLLSDADSLLVSPPDAGAGAKTCKSSATSPQDTTESTA